MRKKMLYPLYFFILFIVGSGCLALENPAPADLAVVNSRIFTANENMPWAKALAVTGDKISYVGELDGLKPYIGKNTQILDAKGQFMMPGFVDNHNHILWMGALQSILTSMYEAENYQQVANNIGEFAKSHPDYPFILGVGWRYFQMPKGGPTKAMLDEIIPDRPAFIWALDGQTGWSNSKGIALMQAKNPAALHRLNPVMDKNTNQPTGLFHEFQSFNPFDFLAIEKIPTSMQASMKEGVQKALQGAVSVGVTSMNDAQVAESILPLILQWKAEGLFKQVRIRPLLYVHRYILEEKGDKGLEEMLKNWRAFGVKHNDDHFWAGDGIKLYSDGVYGAGSAFLFEPYSNRPGEHGYPLWKQEDFNRAVAIADKLGIQACTHAVGDRGIHMVINAYEHAITVNQSQDARHRIEHCELPIPADMTRMGKLGIYAAMQPTHFYGDEDTENSLGDRVQRYMPWHSLQKAGVNVSFGSDWLAGPINPLYGLALASIRMNHLGLWDGWDWGPDEVIDIIDALRHATIDSAKASRRDKEIGSLEVGKLADFALFTTDLDEIPTVWWLLTHDVEIGKLDDFVSLTVVGGEVVYRKGQPGVEDEGPVWIRQYPTPN